MSLNDEVRELLKTAKLSRYALAKVTGMDQAQLSRFASGERGLAVESIERLLAELGYELRIVRTTQRRPAADTEAPHRGRQARRGQGGRPAQSAKRGA